MWFKNLQIYQFTDKVSYEAEKLEKSLSSAGFMPCEGPVLMTMGWVAPMTKREGPLVYAANGFLLMCLKVEEKVIPPAVVKEHVDEKVALIEEKEHRKVSKKEKQSLKDEIHFTLMSRAFTKATYIYAYIDCVDGYLAVDAVSMKQAEMFTSFLRKTLGSLKIVLPETQNPSTIMTQWLRDKKTLQDFVIEDACVLQDPAEEGGNVRSSKQDLFSKNIQSFIDVGYFVSQMKFSWCEQLSFVLNNEFSIKQLRFLDAVKDQAKDSFTETEEERFDADFTVMSMTLRLFMQSLMHVFALEEEKAAAEPETVE